MAKAQEGTVTKQISSATGEVPWTHVRPFHCDICGKNKTGGSVTIHEKEMCQDCIDEVLDVFVAKPANTGLAYHDSPPQEWEHHPAGSTS